MRKIFFLLYIAIFTVVFAGEQKLPFGTAGFSLKFADSKTSENLVFYHNDIPLCSQRMTVEMFERRGIGYQGNGGQWTIFNPVTDIRKTADTAEYQEVVAKVVSEVNNPPVRPINLVYRLRLWKNKNKISMKVLSVTGTSPIEVQFRIVALPIKFYAEKLDQISESDKMIIEFSSAKMIISTFPAARVEGALSLRPKNKLWLLPNEAFDPELPEYFWNFIVKK